MFSIGILSAPRSKPTIYNTIKSLRKRNFTGEIIVYSEPQELNEIEGVTVKYNKEKLGCFKNYDNALNDMIENAENDFIAVIGDDFQFSTIMMNKIRYSTDGYHALYTPRGLINTRPYLRQHGWHPINEGWAGTWGGNYMMHKEIAKKIVGHEYYQNHLNNYEKNEQVDHCIPEVCFQLGFNQYFHSPSLCNHVGKHSTLGHKHTFNEEGLFFRR